MKLYAGARCGRGVVLEILPYHQPCIKKLVMLCDCGRKYFTYSPAFYVGASQSCGCLHKERITKHGHSSKLIWARWKIMIARCYNPKNKSYPNYGGRGITVCQEWRDSFERFIEDMGMPEDGMTIDRIDVNGPYSKENCRWATRGQQMRNMRRNRRFECRGEMLTVAEMAEKYGINPDSLSSRIYQQGLSIEEAISLPIGKNGKKQMHRNWREVTAPKSIGGDTNESGS